MKECYRKIVLRWCEYQTKEINRLRKKNHITIKYISDELGVTNSLITKLLKGNDIINHLIIFIAIKMLIEKIEWQNELDELPF